MGRSRLSTGTGIDAILDGGIRAGRALLVSGPPGSGKSLIALSYLNEGLKSGEECMFLSFRPIPLRSILETARQVPRLESLLDSDRPLFYSIPDPDGLSEIDAFPKACRVVMDHPDALSLSGIPDWGKRLSFTMNMLRDGGAGILVTTYDARSPLVHICEDVLELVREEGRMRAHLLGWPCPSGDIAREKEAGEWMI